MNRTTKILLAVAAVIVLSYPAVAWVTGIAIENRMQQTQEHALEQMPYLTLITREYHRGVYRSTEVATYGLHNPVPRTMQAAGGGGLRLPHSVTITLTSNIEHGPLPGLHAPALAIVDTTISSPPALQQVLSGALGSKPLFEVHSTIGLFGGTTAILTSPAFTLRLPDGSSIAWGGLTGSATATRKQAHWSAELSAPRLAVQGAQGGFELAGIEYSGSHDKAFDNLYMGTSTFTIERVDGSSARAGAFSLQRISLTGNSQADGDFFDLRLDAAMDAAKVAAVQLKNVMYSESFEHVHGPSLAAMAQALRAAERQTASNPAQGRAGMQDAFRQYGGELLLHDPVIAIRQVSFTMPEGSFLFSARISAPGLARADLQWPAVIMALRTHAQVTADLRVDNGLVQKLQTMGGAKVSTQLTTLEQEAYLSAGATAVTTHLEYAGGKLTLNGHPFPPATAVN